MDSWFDSAGLFLKLGIYHYGPPLEGATHSHSGAQMARKLPLEIFLGKSPVILLAK